MIKGLRDSEIKTMCGDKLSLDDIHQRLLSMMKSFDLFCKKNNLVYYPAGGTLIGAIRHNGFIPWDDDVDFYMPRSDYEKLISFSKISDDIDVVSIKHCDIYYHPFQHCNLADKRTIIISHQLRLNTGKGQFIDIFPLDNVPNNKSLKNKLLKKLHKHSRICSFAINSTKGIRSIKGLLVKVMSLFYRHVPIQKELMRIDLLAQKYNKVICDKWGPICRGAEDKFIWDKSYFETVERHKFETIEINVPCGYDQILKHTFGDYLTPPPMNQRGNQHNLEVFWRK